VIATLLWFGGKITFAGTITIGLIVAFCNYLFLTMLPNADQILVINEGELIESGKHEALLEEKGFNYKLYTSQFKGLSIDV